MSGIYRRQMLRDSLGLSGAILGGMSLQHRSAMAQSPGQPAPNNGSESPTGPVPRGKFGKYELSRLFIGGDPVSGIAHAGELVYQQDFMLKYFTSEKILETLALAEQSGINTMLMRADDRIMTHYTRYTKERGGKLHWIANTAPETGDPVENAKHARDKGVIAVYLHGGVSDRLISDGKVDQIGEVVEGIKKLGIMAGIGSHLIETSRACISAKLDPDFYMMTINRVNYWCSEAAEVGNFMRSVRKPWIAFKVLGAGRVKPREGFHLAFAHGADFLAVGMFDWQVRENAAIVSELLTKGIERDRAWA